MSDDRIRALLYHRRCIEDKISELNEDMERIDAELEALEREQEEKSGRSGDKIEWKIS